MPVFKIGVPIETDEPAIKVEISDPGSLPVGKHRFQLVVIDDANNESAPADLIVQVIDTTRPNAILDGPSRVDFGQAFELSGRKSVDIGGKVVRFRWLLLE